MDVRIIVIALLLASAAPIPAPSAMAQTDTLSGVTVAGDNCKRQRFRRDCKSASEISRYGVKNYWEVVYVVIDGKWILAEESEYSAQLDERCGHEAFAYLKKIAPVSDRRVPSVLSGAQDRKEACELAQIRADGLVAVNTALGVNALDINDYRVFRYPKAELSSAPPEAQAMLAPWLAQRPERD